MIKMMDNKEVVKIIRRELKEKRYALTKQFLDNHSIEQKGGKPTFDMYKDKLHKQYYASVKLIGQDYRLMYYISFDGEIIGINLEPYVRIYFWVEAKEKGETEASSEFFDALPFKRVDTIRKKNRLIYEPDKDIFIPYEIKMQLMCEELYSMKSKLLQLTNLELGLNIVYSANCNFLGGINLEREHINLFAQIGISIDIDLYASSSGNN